MPTLKSAERICMCSWPKLYIEIKGAHCHVWAHVLLGYIYDPHVFVGEIEGKHYYLLHAKEFDDAQPDGLASEAIPLLRRLNALMDMYAPGNEPVAIGREVFKRHSDREWEKVTPYFYQRYRWLPFASHPPEPPGWPNVPSFVQAAAAKLSTAPGFVIDAIEHLGAFPVVENGDQDGVQHYSRLDNWHDLYKAFEALGKDNGLIKLGVAKNQTTRFSATAQLFRHHENNTEVHAFFKAGRETGDPNKQPMTLEEGKELIFTALKNNFLSP